MAGGQAGLWIEASVACIWTDHPVQKLRFRDGDQECDVMYGLLAYFQM